MKEIYKYLFVFLGCMFIFPLISNAQCSYERQAELSRIAANVQTSYNYSVVEKRPEFTVNINNITNDVYVKERETDSIITKEINDFDIDVSGKTMIYDIYSNDGNCKDKLLLTKYVTLPNYNAFSAINDCTIYPEFKYCKMWMNTENITQEVFDSELEKYKASDAMVIDDDGGTNGNIIIEFFAQNKKWIMIITASIILIMLLLFVKRRMKK